MLNAVCCVLCAVCRTCAPCASVILAQAGERQAQQVLPLLARWGGNRSHAVYLHPLLKFAFCLWLLFMLLAVAFVFMNWLCSPCCCQCCCCCRIDDNCILACSWAPFTSGSRFLQQIFSFFCFYLFASDFSFKFCSRRK